MIKVIDEVFDSSLTKRKHSFKALLPESYEISDRLYPALYLLHGLFGSSANWLELTGLQDYLRGCEVIVILPEGEDKWYTDGARIAEDKFESSFTEELIPAIEKKYKVSASRERRAVAGLSMGGYGAFKFALKRPDLFVFAGSMSGAFQAARIVENGCPPEWQELLPSLCEAFGEADDATRIENDLFKIVQEIPAENVNRLPDLYFDCGTEDDFLKVNNELAGLLEEKNIAFEYREISGGHDWNYWDKQVRVILEKTAKIFNRTSPSNLEKNSLSEI